MVTVWSALWSGNAGQPAREKAKLCAFFFRSGFVRFEWSAGVRWIKLTTGLRDTCISPYQMAEALISKEIQASHRKNQGHRDYRDAQD